jgi:LysR family transcriptional regulator, transcriptional activator of the cysJI operon
MIFHKAAERLFLTQPAATQQVKALEDELGVRLFDRTPKGVSLTEQGSLLLRYAQKAATLADKAVEELASGDGKLSGSLRWECRQTGAGALDRAPVSGDRGDTEE